MGACPAFAARLTQRSRRQPVPGVGADASAAVARGAEFQPVDLDDLGGEDGQVVLIGSARCHVGSGLRQRRAGGGQGQIVARSGRRLDALPDGVDLGPAGLQREPGPHAELPLEAIAPEHEHGPGVSREFARLGAAVVGESGERLLLGTGRTQHHRAGVDVAIRGGRGQHGRAPGVMAIVTGAGELLPDAVADVGGGVQAGLHGDE